jgi:ATP-dependent DNA helicase DinG
MGPYSDGVEHKLTNAVSPVDPEIEAALGPGGAFAQTLPGFRSRRGQLEMASAVLAALRASTSLIVEAGTGTGKTFAYLVPALLAGGKVIVSTGTRTLQDQLFHRDLPVVKRLLGIPVDAALLKGRANYVCHHHLHRTVAEGRLASRDEVRHLRAIERFLETTGTGDRAELGGVPETASIWAQVTSTRENCLGQECAFHADCFLLAARRRAQQADIVVVNHHLFFADVMLKDEGAGELLPNCNAVIFDEAHQLPEVASLFFGDSVSTTQILDLTRDARAEGRSLGAFPPEAEALLDRVDTGARELRLAFSEREGRFAQANLPAGADFDRALAGLRISLNEVSGLLEALSGRSDGMLQCARRSEELRSRVHAWLGAPSAGIADPATGCASAWEEDVSDGAAGARLTEQRAGSSAEVKATEQRIRWLELFQQSLHLNSTPLSVASVFRRQVEQPGRTWVFTSATLSVAGDFQHYQAQMGLEAAGTGRWESPFDYAQQALFFVPEGLPAPNTPAYTSAVVEAALPLILASQGRAFFLFTSLRALAEAHELLGAALEQHGSALPLLVQGQASRGELLEQFRTLGNAVLLGSQSFWEGVDVKGEALSLVIIDKLPFAAPDDPVLAARLAEIKRSGGNAFMDYQLPQAVITLKQGAGRLIRDELDHGVLMICDPRLLNKPYGKRIWRSLPPMRRTRESRLAERFLSCLRAPPD